MPPPTPNPLLWNDLILADLCLCVCVVLGYFALSRRDPLQLAVAVAGAAVVVYGSLELWRSVSGLLLVAQAAAFAVLAIVWTWRGGKTAKTRSHGRLYVALFGGLFLWAVLILVGLLEARTARGWRILGAIAIATPLLLFFLHMGRCFQEERRLSDGAFLFGLFIVLPLGVVGPHLVLGRAGMSAVVFWYLLGTVAFATMTIAWSRRSGQAC